MNNQNLPDTVINNLSQRIEGSFNSLCYSSMESSASSQFEWAVNESVSDTLKEQMESRWMDPLFQQKGIQLPRGTQPLLERLVEHDPYDPLNYYLSKLG